MWPGHPEDGGRGVREKLVNRRILAVVVFGVLCIACTVHALWHYPRLPAQAAWHFNAYGLPDAWVGKQQFFGIYLAAIGGTALAFLGLSLAMKKIPVSVIDLPHKDYWLAPERRRQTLDFLVPHFLWFGALTLLLLLALAHLAFQFHLGKSGRLLHAGLSLKTYAIVSAAWCLAAHLKFRKKA